MSTTTILTYAYFKVSLLWFRLRLTKLEELLGLDIIEDSQVLQLGLVVKEDLFNKELEEVLLKEQSQRMELITLVRMGE